jgi:glucose/arabinose dehydrogenase
MRHIRSAAVVGLLALLLASPAAEAQLRVQQVVAGLTSPVEFVPDPSDASVLYVLEQAGRVRVIRSGVLLDSDFLDLRGSISSGGERGLLGFAFAPDYASSGRVYVNFTNPAGHTVVARFLRNGPTSVSLASRFDLQWPGGQRFIAQPFANHNGGHLAFGPDGFLYIGMGDGGSANDPQHRAQNPTELLGKMLRIDVNVPLGDAKGYRLPVPANPPTVAGALGEIWAFGLRNPWKFSFDRGTGAMVIGDVGQGAWEEIDYQPASFGGRNYGWRNREGKHDNVTNLPPAYTPLTDPIFEYSHAVGISITGGYVYRGSDLPTSFRGRYFFADLTGRVWSLGLTLGGPAGATASDLVEHTDEFGGTANIGAISSMGQDLAGELYILGYSTGTLWRITSLSRPAMAIDSPSAGTRLLQPFSAAGWAIDRAAPAGTGVDLVHVWSYPNPGSGRPPVFAGVASYGTTRNDVGAAFGTQFASSGFQLSVNGLPPGPNRLTIFAHSTVTGQFSGVQTVDIIVRDKPAVTIDTPRNGASIAEPFHLAGWAAEVTAPSGTAVDVVHVWAYPNPGSGQPPVFVGVAPYGSSRPDVASAFGESFRFSGYDLLVGSLTPGRWQLAVFARSTATGTFTTVAVVNVTIHGTPAMSLDLPGTGAVDRPFVVSGWAIDASAPTGTGVDVIHVWAFPVDGRPPVFLGAAPYGLRRDDVGGIFGPRFTSSGFSLSVGGLAPGAYTIVAYAHSSFEGLFTQSRAVGVTVR